MAFFPTGRGDPKPERRRRTDGSPIERDERLGVLPGEFGTSVSIPGSQFTFADVAIAFDQYTVFEPGFIVTMRVLYRAPQIDTNDWALDSAIFGEPGKVPYVEQFVWGIELADGRKGYGVPVEASDADFYILATAGGGDAVRASYDFWVHTKPTPEMSIYIAWPGRGIEETSITVDAAPLVEASAADSRISNW